MFEAAFRSASAPAAATTAIKPGPWNPPGGQPIPFYIGTTAHIGIAGFYAAEHLGQIAFYNFTAMSTILSRWSQMGNTANTEPFQQCNSV